MALSDDKLWDLWNAQGTDNMSNLSLPAPSKPKHGGMRWKKRHSLSKRPRTAHAGSKLASTAKPATRRLARLLPPSANSRRIPNEHS